MNGHIPAFTDDNCNMLRGDIVTLLERISSGLYLSTDNNISHEFMLNFEESNKKVAKYFLGRSNGKLFLENKPIYNRHLPEKIDIEKAFEIFSYLWGQKQEQIIQKNSKRYKEKLVRMISRMRELLFTGH